MSFYVGCKVICIEDCHGVGTLDKLPGHCPGGIPKEGMMFVVMSIICIDDRMSLALSGTPFIRRGRDCGWVPHKFRPLEELQQESKERYYAEHPIHA